MTLEQAEQIRDLLNLRDHLISELKRLTKCVYISGDMCDGVNGVSFKWDKDSYKIKYLIEGTEKEIKRVEESIFKFSTNNL